MAFRYGDNRDRYTPQSHGWTMGGNEWAKADSQRSYVDAHTQHLTKLGPFTIGGKWKTNQEMKEQEHGVTLRYGEGKNKGKIASMTDGPGGNFSMRHLYQAKISNELRKNWARKNNPDSSVSNPMGWDN